MSEKSNRPILIVIAIAVVVIAAALVLPQAKQGADNARVAKKEKTAEAAEAAKKAAYNADPYKEFMDAAMADYDVGLNLKDAKVVSVTNKEMAAGPDGRNVYITYVPAGTDQAVVMEAHVVKMTNKANGGEVLWHVRVADISLQK